MKKKLLGGLLVVAILASAGIVATRANITEASTRAQVGPDASGLTGVHHSKSSGKPFVGIGIASVPDGSDTEGALIVRVVSGSAADGNLSVDDIITAIDGESISGPGDVVRIVREHSPGDTVVFTVMRGGTSTNVSITLGEQDASFREGIAGKRGGFGHGYLGKAGGSLVLSDTRYMTDDGVKTVRRAFGAAQNINANTGTFDLLLRDDSETLTFTIDDDTKIATDTVEGDATLSDLGADATTMVVQVTQPDGTSQVQSVVQGDFSLTMHSLLGRDGFGRMHRFGAEDSNGFSPRKFFFGWFGDRDGSGRNDNHERRGNRHN